MEHWQSCICAAAALDPVQICLHTLLVTRRSLLNQTSLAFKLWLLAQSESQRKAFGISPIYPALSLYLL